MAELRFPYSHQISTGEQCRLADSQTIGKLGIDGFTLMETAGLQAAKLIGDKTAPSSTGLFVCGKGNNAGDALVVARYLAIHHNHICHIYFPAGYKKLSQDTEKNLNLIQKLTSEGLALHIHDSDKGDKVKELNIHYAVDGLLGTGLNSNLRAPFKGAVNFINSLNCPVYSLDIPTGLHTDTGQTMPEAVQADYTLSFGSLKIGFYLHEGPASCGEIHHFGLAFPGKYRNSIASLITADLDSVIPKIHRSADHKYSDRVLYIIAGSEGLTGAAIMSARSGWNAGAGAVILITPRGLLDIYEKTLPGIIKAPVGQENDTLFLEEHSETVLEILNQKNGVMLIGPGLGRKKSTNVFSKNILSAYKHSAVIDADALHVIPESEIPANADWILTPHPGEAKALSQKSFKNDFQRIQWATDYAQEKSLTVLAKGNPTFTGTPDGKNYLTGYNSRLFARAGFGDVLAGKIAGYLAISGDKNLSIIRALLDGYMKAEKLSMKSEAPLEPNDLL